MARTNGRCAACHATLEPLAAYFTRIATMPVYKTLAEGVDPATQTSAEIITATKDGQTLVFSDSPGEAVVFVDIANPAEPKPAGPIAMGGEPTSVTAAQNFILAGPARRFIIDDAVADHIDAHVRRRFVRGYARNLFK